MARSNPLSEMRRICLSLPETAETMTWGQPHFRVRGKIFTGIGDHAGIENISFKLEREHADAVIQDPRFYRAPYVGAHGWVSMRVEEIRDWNEVRALLLESYRLIAPKTLWAIVQGKAPAKDPGTRSTKFRAPRRKPAAKKTRRSARR
jgi:predicted DNA-binding protein (MmcQ/YjbR family)